MEDITHHQRTYRHDSYIMFLVMVDVELNGPSGRMLEWPTFKVTFHILFLFYSHYIILENFVIFESGPFSFHIQPISLQYICNHLQ
ncbi:hypothetical protein HKD37_14G039947 [Glycine soja]